MSNELRKRKYACPICGAGVIGYVNCGELPGYWECDYCQSQSTHTVPVFKETANGLARLKREYIPLEEIEDAPSTE